jgi:hypothetical protein
VAVKLVLVVEVEAVQTFLHVTEVEEEAEV